MTSPDKVQEIQDALDWADKATDICYSSGTGHSEAKVLAAAYRDQVEEIERLKEVEKERDALKSTVAELEQCLRDANDQYHKMAQNWPEIAEYSRKMMEQAKAEASHLQEMFDAAKKAIDQEKAENARMR